MGTGGDRQIKPPVSRCYYWSTWIEINVFVKMPLQGLQDAEEFQYRTIGTSHYPPILSNRTSRLILTLNPPRAPSKAQTRNSKLGIICKIHLIQAILRKQLNSFRLSVLLEEISYSHHGLIHAITARSLIGGWIAIREVEGTMTVRSLDMALVNRTARSIPTGLRAGLEALQEAVAHHF